MTLRLTLFMFSLVGLSACGPSFDIVDKAGMPMFEIRKGFCAVGCGLKVRRADGAKCSGWAPDLEEGMSLIAQVKCPGDPHPRELRTEVIHRESAAVGTLGDPMTLEQRNKKASAAALALAEELSQNN